MLPGSFVAALLLVALVPGYLFLSRTRGYREATESDTPLESLLGIVTVGVATTGTTTIGFVLVFADRIACAARELNNDSWDGSLLRDVALAVGLILGVACLLAWGAAGCVRRLVPKRYHPRALKEVLAERRHEFTWVRLELRDKSVLLGALHGSDFAVDSGSRDIVLRSPLKRNTGDGFDEVEASRIVVPEDEVRVMMVTYSPRPAGDNPPRWWRRALARLRAN